MSNPYFQFKEFVVYHDKSSMQVNTDSVLLGAWTNVANCNSALDIGAGSGLISLMIAQRSNSFIDAIDIDFESVLQAKENFINSKWKDRISSLNISLQDYYKICNKKYDLIISNPPYFSKSLRNPKETKANARHNDSLSFEELIFFSSKMLTKNGLLSLIIPFNESSLIKKIANKNGLYLLRETIVYPKFNSNPKRLLIELANNNSFSIFTSELFIEKNKRHEFSEEYIDLTKDFYLKF